VVFADAPDFTATITGWLTDGQRGGRLVRLQSRGAQTVDAAIHTVGHVPLPPYITNYQGDDEQYQTVYSKNENSAAAPTAGLHFTERLLSELKTKGVGFATVELEVGLDTFRTVDEEQIEDHQMHTEGYSVSAQVVEAIEATKAAGGKVVAVGTTSVRSLESAWDAQAQRLLPRDHASTSLYITPGSSYNVVDAMITNFHVPRSTLLMMICAFAGYDNVMAAYAQAIARRYRFFSFGDAMLLA
jgi:S-adenosylmethionine:tRNA ribosyltransferase-isomerase